jgi:DNA-binding CsgD family transcriptional regulator
MAVRVPAQLLLAYVFIALVTGAVCIGSALMLAWLRRDELARAFLWLYCALTVAVLGTLLLALAATQPAVSPGTISVLEYLEAFAGRYGVMLTLPLFAHRVFGIRDRRRDAVLIGIVLTSLAAQHVTEFMLGGVWDERGDVAEDAVFAALVAYTVVVGVRTTDGGAYPPLASRLLALLVAALPVAAHDLFIAGDQGPRLYPLWYCALGFVVILSLFRRHAASGAAPPREWGLTEREEEVLRLVKRGLSNQAVARELTISPNTVKTHLRAIFDKSGFRTRAALIAQLGDHPIG